MANGVIGLPAADGKLAKRLMRPGIVRIEIEGAGCELRDKLIVTPCRRPAYAG